jgi:hypothetical protein
VVSAEDREVAQNKKKTGDLHQPVLDPLQRALALSAHPKSILRKAVLDGGHIRGPVADSRDNNGRRFGFSRNEIHVGNLFAVSIDVCNLGVEVGVVPFEGRRALRALFAAVKARVSLTSAS